MLYPMDFNDGPNPEFDAQIDEIVREHREVLRGRGERVDELSDNAVFERWRDEGFAAMIRRFLGGEEDAPATLAEQVAELRRRAEDRLRELPAGGQGSDEAEPSLAEIQWLVVVAEGRLETFERRQATPKAEPPQD
jgi:hypothetical protein